MNPEIFFLILVLLFLPIEITTTKALSTNRHQNKKLYKKYDKFDIGNDLQSGNDVAYYAYERDDHQTDEEQSSTEHAPKPEVDILNCPNGCVCQYARFFDLPISRWISYTQNNRQMKTIKVSSDGEDSFDFENDENFINPYIKQATCILEEDANEIDLINSLPVDLQALILLYTGIGKNKTVNTSSLKPLNQLTTLEIRGTQDRTLRLVFDEPLSFIQHGNFESITLLGSEEFKRPKNQVHPSDSFNYKPKSELYSNYRNNNDDDNDESFNTNETSYSIIDGRKKLGFEAPLEEIEILPYNVYVEEMKRARMPSFYGWDNLEVLRIHSCNLKELYWEMFDGLVSLQHLSLERNNIATVTAFALYGALHIKTLSLAHNHIQDLHYRVLAGLLELETLDLSDNRLSKLSELSFPPFPKLERIDFTRNPIRYIYPATFWVMNGTRVMFFDSEEIPLELRPNEPFESLSRLQELSVENISISNLEQNIFKGLRSLQKLKLRGEIRKVDFDAFAGLVQLQELILNHCGIDDISMDALIGVRKLQVLDLSHNRLSYIPPGLFDDQAGLVEIYLQGNKLQTLPNTFFMQPKLRLAHLNDNPWKCSCSMLTWKSKITNQKHGSRVERCITDFQTKEKIACRTVNEFKFDKSLTPRCDNYNGRSVYYVMRKQLQCGGGKIIYRQPKQHNHKEIQHNKRYDRQNQKRRNDNMIPEIINVTISQKPDSEHEKWHTPFDQQMSNEV